jgi:PAS domain S-box-containing protein
MAASANKCRRIVDLMAIRILIVDDEAIVAESIRIMLKKLGYAATAAVGTAEAAFESVARDRPDLVLMDINLGEDHKGIVAAEAMRDRYGIPVVFLTAYSDASTLRRAKTSHPFGYVTKPFEEQDLRIAVEIAHHNSHLEQRLRESERRLRAILDNISDPAWLKDRAGRHLAVNRAWCQHFALNESDVLGKTDDQVHRADIARRFEKQDQQIYATGLDFRAEECVPRFDTADAWFDTHKIPLLDDTGAIIGITGIARDITQRRLVELERDRLTSELNCKNRELQCVLYAASHDLRSPLLNIQGFSQRLEQMCAEWTARLSQPDCPAGLRADCLALIQEQMPKALGHVRTSVQKMDALISGMLRLSRLEQTSLRYEPLDMNQMLAHIISSTTIQIQAAQAAIEVEPLPNCSGDPMLISQVFSNLIDNALKYRDANRSLTIRVTGSITGNETIYVVADSGSGIVPENQDIIWGLFQRLNPKGPPGEGLGLNLVRRIVERHRGRVWVESTPGTGSQFHVALPIKRHAG